VSNDGIDVVEILSATWTKMELNDSLGLDLLEFHIEDKLDEDKKNEKQRSRRKKR
jgi:hypothetical protein